MKKKILLLTISILMVTAAFAKAGNPIPSYNVVVSNSAYFQEESSTPGCYSPSDERRDMNISNDTPGNGPIGSGGIIVYVYRLDQSIVLGPFLVHAGETFSVKIDGYPWGVITQTTEPTLVSVWIGNPQQL